MLFYNLYQSVWSFKYLEKNNNLLNTKKEPSFGELTNFKISIELRILSYLNIQMRYVWIIFGSFSHFVLSGR